MQTVIRKGIREMVIEDVPDPIAGPHHVLVRPVFSLISSGTESASIHQEGLLKEVADNPSHLGKILGVMKANGPVPTLREVRAKLSELTALGYAGAGVVVEKHSTVRDLEIGDRVAYGGEGTGHAETVVTGRNLVARIPPQVRFDQACFATLGSIALNGVRIAQIGLGDRVVVIGLGLVGQLVAQLARLQGAFVMATDLRAERSELARELGAGLAMAGDTTIDQVGLATDGRGADCVIIAAAAKSSGPCKLALELCRDRGRIVVLGAVEMAFDWNAAYLKEVQVLMARAYGPGSYDASYEKGGHDYPYAYVRWTENRNMEEFMRLVGEGSVRVDPLVTHRFKIADGEQAYKTILDPEAQSLAVLLEYAQPDSQGQVKFQLHRSIPIHAAAKGKNQIGVAVVGAGNLARWAHLPALQSSKRVSLRSIQSNNGVRAKSYGARFKAAYCTTDLKQVLSDPEVDLVFILSRNQLHAEQVVAALEAGKHVFVEKPMAITEEECKLILKALQRSGSTVSVGFNRRFSPFYREMKQRLEKRTSPAVINVRVNSPGISGKYWMADPAIGGAILGEACHFVDLMYWLLEAEPVSVSAFSLPTGTKEPIGENNLVASFQFADGSVANLTYCTVGSRTSAGERVEIFIQGMALETSNFQRLTTHGKVREAKKRLFAEKGYETQIEDIVVAIQNGKPPSVTAVDGARATMVCLKMLEAARLGQTREITWQHLFDE